jgi:hypothetical protein
MKRGELEEPTPLTHTHIHTHIHTHSLFMFEREWSEKQEEKRNWLIEIQIYALSFSLLLLTASQWNLLFEAVL